jgi:superfamily I DNA and/or RNA helicase
LQNPVEADVIVSLLRQWSEHEALLKWMGKRSEGEQIIGVICAYASQRDLIWKKLRSENLPDAFRRRVKVDTIDSYQGKENLIVLLSLVRNNSDGPKDMGAPTIAPGFMGRKNRINVALSRAMDRLVIVGAKGRWRDGTPLGLVSVGFDEEDRNGGATIVDCVEILNATKPGKKKSKKGALPTVGNGGNV